MEVKLGDKLWMRYGPETLIVGHLVDTSPNQEILGISPMPYAKYSKLKMEERITIPINWLMRKYLTFLDKVPFEQVADIYATEEPLPLGFTPQ